MNIELREFKRPDIRRLEEWASRIDSGKYMSRYRPVQSAVDGHNPALGLFWFVIQVSGVDVGTIWLERSAQPDELVLGILLGDRSLFGRGIGSKAIGEAVEKVQSQGKFRSVRLNVRSSNARAIACYKKAGFIAVATGVKDAAGGVIPYVTMLRPLK